MQTISHEDFADKLQSQFDMLDEQGKIHPLVLEKIDVYPARRMPDSPREPFSLIFAGTHGVLCPQGNYLLRHASGWEAAMFIVPIGDRPDGAYVYQAVYN